MAFIQYLNTNNYIIYIISLNINRQLVLVIKKFNQNIFDSIISKIIILIGIKTPES